MADAKSETIWTMDALKPYHMDFMRRGQTLRHRKSYYDGTMYKGFNPGSLEGMKWELKVVTQRCCQVDECVMTLYQCMNDVVQKDRALVPGKWLLTEESAPYQAAVDAVLKHSEWAKQGELYVHYGASMGNVGLYINSDLQIQVVRPDNIYIAKDCGKAVMGIICQPKQIKGEWVEWAYVFTEDAWFEYIRGERVNDGDGYGFIPVIDVPFIDVGEELGESTYQAQIDPLNALNKLSTQLFKNIDRNSFPQWFVATDGDAPKMMERSDQKIWFGEAGSSVDAIVAALDIPGVMQMADSIRENMEKHLAEMALVNQTVVNRLAYDTLELQMSALVTKIWMIRKQLDCGLKEALMMIGRIAQADGRDPRLVQLADGMFDFDNERQVLPMSEHAKIDLRLKRLLEIGAEQSIDAEANLSGAWPAIAG